MAINATPLVARLLDWNNRGLTATCFIGTGVFDSNHFRLELDGTLWFSVEGAPLYCDQNDVWAVRKAFNQVED